MIRILLDTPIFICWNGSSTELSPTARSLCNNPGHQIVLSMASIWEMQIKHQLGKLNFITPLMEIIRLQQENNGLEILPIYLTHIDALSSLPHHHRDPFDRLLIAQSQVENIVVLSADAMFRQYPIRVLS